MAKKLKNIYGTVYARDMYVTYDTYRFIADGNFCALEDAGIKINTKYYIRCVRKALDKEHLLLELFEDKNFTKFVGAFHSSWFSVPKFDTIAGNILYEK